jgi:Flp pilus assembly protein TadB
MAVRYATLRASDADRDAVAERLRRAAIEGRLDPDELDERLDTALRAKTYGELDRLVADLPGMPATPRRPQRSRQPQRKPAIGVAFAIALRVAFVLAVAVAVAVAVAATVAWWMLIALIWLVAHGSRGCSRHRRPAFHRQPIP